MTSVAPAPTAAPRTEPVGACPLCGTADAPVFFRSPDRQHDTPGEFTYKRCARCRTVFQDPRVIAADLGLCYPAEYGTHYVPPEAAPSTPAGPAPVTSAPVRSAPAEPAPAARDGVVRVALRAALAAVRGQPEYRPLPVLGRALARARQRRTGAASELLDELRPWRAGPLRALDAGCGAGGLLVRLTRAGYDVEGVEVDPAAADVARAVSGRPVRVGDFRAVELPERAYDLVVLSHVFEHVDDPLGALRRLRALVAPGGRVVLLYPNPESLGARVFAAAWFNWDPPRHLVIPPGRSLAAAAVGAGFSVRRLRTVGPNAVIDFKHSRGARAGLTGAALRVPPESPWDEVSAFGEHLLTRARLPLGEEVVLALDADG